jgi:hypothetical protein
LTAGLKRSEGIQRLAPQDLRGHAAWGVSLPSLVYQSEIDAVWRDLHARYGAMLNGKMLFVVRQGGLSDRVDERQSWYAIVLGDFVEKPEAEGFCAALRKRLKGCNVVQISSTGLQ